MRKVALALALLGVVLPAPAPALAVLAEPAPHVVVPAAGTGGQLRAYWVDAFGAGFNTPAEIDQLVADVKAANLNAIMAQIVRRGDCWCNNAAVPRTDDPAVAAFPFDPLQTLIEKAHAQGIEVHAWVIANAMWKGTRPPSSPQHIYNLHGPAAQGADSWLMTRSDGLNKLADDWMLDPGHPDAADWIVRMAASIVAGYAVDGINLDRIRYPDGNLGALVPSWGYNPVSVARFQAATGRTDRPGNTDAQWMEWRRDQVTGIVRKVYLESYAIRPSVRVSADTITYGDGPQTTGGWERTRAYAEVLQDWRGWLREGILDLNVTMNYKRDLSNTPGSNDQRRMFQEWSDFAKDSQFGRATATGAALYLNDIASSARQAQTAVATSANGNSGAGWAGYSYRTPDTLTDAGARSGAASRAALQAALLPVFSDAVPVPAMPWKTQPTLGHVRGTALADDGTPLAGTQIELFDGGGAVARSVTSDGTGWYGFVDVPPGRYRVRTTSARVADGLIGTVEVTAGNVLTPTRSAVVIAPCDTSTTGPGIPPPAAVASGIGGFHASWYGQSGYPTLCPGARSTATVAYHNSGSRGWRAGVLGEVAYLGTWAPDPGQDRASTLGGDGALGSPNTGWPRYNRIATQPADYVGPGQVAWFQFTIQAPARPGTYRLYLRPLIEGASWLEDYGVYWVVTVKG